MHILSQDVDYLGLLGNLHKLWGRGVFRKLNRLTREPSHQRKVNRHAQNHIAIYSRIKIDENLLVANFSTAVCWLIKITNGVEKNLPWTAFLESNKSSC